MEEWKVHGGRIPCPFAKNGCGKVLSDQQISNIANPETAEKYSSIRTRTLKWIASEEEHKIGMQLNKMQTRASFKAQVKHHFEEISEHASPRCPKCKVPFGDFVNCAVLSCLPSCRCSFCAWCLQEFKDLNTAHKHISECPENISANKNAYPDMPQWRKYMHEKSSKAVSAKILEISCPKTREAVKEKMIQHFQLEIKPHEQLKHVN
jgi:hypothetical protein